MGFDLLLLLAMLGHVGLVGLLYAALTWARRRAVQRGANAYAAFEFGDGGDVLAARLSANLRNQFEAPVLFYAGVFALLYLEAASLPASAAGAVFLAGRVLHTGVQVFTGNVALRGMVFTINFLGVIALWGLIGWALLERVPIGQAHRAVEPVLDPIGKTRSTLKFESIGPRPPDSVRSDDALGRLAA